MFRPDPALKKLPSIKRMPKEITQDPRDVQVWNPWYWEDLELRQMQGQKLTSPEDAWIAAIDGEPPPEVPEEDEFCLERIAEAVLSPGDFDLWLETEVYGTPLQEAGRNLGLTSCAVKKRAVKIREKLVSASTFELDPPPFFTKKPKRIK